MNQYSERSLRVSTNASENRSAIASECHLGGTTLRKLQRILQIKIDLSDINCERARDWFFHLRRVKNFPVAIEGSKHLSKITRQLYPFFGVGCDCFESVVNAVCSWHHVR